MKKLLTKPVALAALLGMIALVTMSSVASAGVILGSPDLPPNDGVYRSPADIHAQYKEGALDIILKKPEHKGFTNVVREDIGGDELETFDSHFTAVVDILASPYGSFLDVPVELTGPVEVLTSGKTGNQTGTSRRRSYRWTCRATSTSVWASSPS